MEKSYSSDDAVLADLGGRLKRRRLDAGLSQAALAAEAGVGQSTVERLEAGQSTQLRNVVRVLRALGLLDRVLAAVPAAELRPMALLERRGKPRRRAGRRPPGGTADKPWTWQEDR